MTSTLVTSSTPTIRPQEPPSPPQPQSLTQALLLPCSSSSLALHFLLYHELTPNRLFPHHSAQILLVKVNDSLHVAKNQGQFSGLVLLSPRHLTQITPSSSGVLQVVSRTLCPLGCPSSSRATPSQAPWHFLFTSQTFCLQRSLCLAHTSSISSAPLSSKLSQLSALPVHSDGQWQIKCDVP